MKKFYIHKRFVHTFSFILSLAVLFLFFLNCFLAFPQENLIEPTWVYYGRGNRFLHDRKLGYALAEYKKALKKENDISNKTGKKDEYFPDICFKIAEVYFDEGLYEASLLYINIAEKNSEIFQIPDRIFSVYYLAADNYFSLGKMDKVVETYKKIINKDNNWDYFKSLRSDQMPDFMYSKEKKIKFGPAYYNLGKIKYDNGNFDNAIVYLRMSFLYGYNAKLTSNLLKNCYKNIGMDFMIKKIDEMIEGLSVNSS